MTQPAIPTASHDSNGQSSARAKLTQIIEDALARTEGRIAEAAEAVSDQIETQPEMILAVVGDEWSALLERYVRRVAFSPDGRRLHQAMEIAKKNRERQPSSDDVAAHASSVLWTTLIGARPLALASKRQVVGEAARNAAEAKQLGVRAKFLELVAEAVPSDTAVVKDHVTVDRANALWAQATA